MIKQQSISKSNYILRWWQKCNVKQRVGKITINEICFIQNSSIYIMLLYWSLCESYKYYLMNILCYMSNIYIHDLSISFLTLAIIFMLRKTNATKNRRLWWYNMYICISYHHDGQRRKDKVWTTAFCVDTATLICTFEKWQNFVC